MPLRKCKARAFFFSKFMTLTYKIVLHLGQQGQYFIKGKRQIISLPWHFRAASNKWRVLREVRCSTWCQRDRRTRRRWFRWRLKSSGPKHSGDAWSSQSESKQRSQPELHHLVPVENIYCLIASGRTVKAHLDQAVVRPPMVSCTLKKTFLIFAVTSIAGHIRICNWQCLV